MVNRLKWGVTAAALLMGGCALGSTEDVDPMNLGGAGSLEEVRTLKQLAEPTATVGDVSARSLRCQGGRQVVEVSVGRDKFKKWDRYLKIFTVVTFWDPDTGESHDSVVEERDCKSWLGRLRCEEFINSYRTSVDGSVEVRVAHYEAKDQYSINRHDWIGEVHYAFTDEPRTCTIEDGSVLLRHVKSGQCLYSPDGNGGPTKHWQCWNDPGMAFQLDPAAGGYRLRNTSTGQCLYGHPNNGGEVRHWQCWDDPNMVFDVVDLGSGQVRLKHRQTGKCVYAAGGNGGTTHVWDCWNDPNMVFSLDALP